MSQAPTDVSGLRMTFEGVPDDLLATIDTIEARMDALEKKSISSANKSEEAVKKYYRSWIDGIQDTEDLTLATLAGVQKEIEGIEAPLREVGDISENTGKKAAASFESMGTAIDGSTSGLRKFSGAISGALGSVTGLIGVGSVLVTMFVALSAAFKELNGSKDGSTQKTTQNLQEMFDVISGGGAASSQFPVFDALEERIDNLQTKLNKEFFDATDASVGVLDVLKGIRDLGGADNLEGTYWGDAKKKRVAEMRAELQRLLKTREALTEKSREKDAAEDLGFGDEAVDRFKAFSSSIENIVEQSEAIRRSLIDDPAERLEAEIQFAIESARRTMIELGVLQTEQGQELLAAIRARGEAERNELRETAAEKDRLAEQSAAKQIALNNKILNDASNNLQQSFGEDVTRLLTTIIKKVDKAGRRAGRTS